MVFHDLLSKSDKHTLVITPNQRLCLILEQHYAELNKNTTYPAPKIKSYSHWLKKCFFEIQDTGLVEPKILLDSFQAKLIWKKLVQKQDLINPHQASHSAMQAWDLCQKYQIPYEEFQNHDQLDVKIFSQWADEFITYCKKNNFVTESQLANYVSENCQTITYPKKIIFTGFEEFTPDCVNLQNNINSTIQKYNHVKNKTHQKFTIQFTNPIEQIKQIGLYSKELIKNYNQIKIGLVVPDLNSSREQINTILTKIFGQTLLAPLSNPELLPFNISAGLPLSNYAVIKSALVALNPDLHLDYYSRSPFVVNKDVEFYNSEKHLPSQWAKLFTDYFIKLHWPGNTGLNSHEYQCVNRFKLVLNQYCLLDKITGLCDINYAISLLTQLCDETVFQPQSHPANIQVLGVLESVGYEFDYCFFINLNDEVWPPKPKLNPFLPSQYQIQHKLPHSTAEREMAFCKNLLETLISFSKNLICTYSEMDADKHCLPSGLIKSFQEYPETLKQQNNNLVNKLTNQKIDLDIINDNFGPEFANNNSKGGSGLFKLQAACPFRAYAQLRLNAKPIEEDPNELNALLKGQLLHGCLEFIWKELKSQENLLSINNINYLINKAIETNYKKINNTNLINVDKKRIFDLLESWLEFEKTREPFEVLYLEKEMNIKIKSLTIKLYIDRIDKLADGTYFVIDYKSSLNSISSWFGERPDEPQMPLYFLNFKDKISQLAYAQIRPEGLKLIGINNQDYDFESLGFGFEEVLNNLSQEYQAGYAEIKPKYGPVTCQYCEFDSLCRVNHDY